MGSLVLDVSKVNSYVLPNLVKSKNILQNAYSTSNTLRNSLPSSFKYRSYVSDIVNQIYNIRREIVDVESMISKKIERAKNIERTRENKAVSISRMASQIGGFVGTVGGAVIGASRGGIVGATTGAVVGNKVGKTIIDTGAKVTKSVISGVKNLGTSIIDGFKWIGTKAVSGVNSAVNWIEEKATSAYDWVADKFNKAVDWGKKAMDATGAFFSKVGSTIWDGLKSAWNWVTDGENWKRLGASIANGVIAFVKGVVSLVEAIGDLVVLLGSAVCTVGTAIYDISSGLATGNWNWSATKGLWKGTKAVVSYQWTNKAFDALYETKAGKWLDEYAYAPFKSDGIGCKILEGVGYVAGVIAVTVLTFGVGGVALGGAASVSAGVSATTMAATATAAGMAKYTSEEWNKNSISLNYGGTDIEIPLDYETYSQIENLKQGESKTITQQLQMEDGSLFELKFTITGKGNGQYDIIDNAGNRVSLNGLNESSTVKGLAIGTVKGLWEGAQWYVGGKINAAQFTKITGKVTSPILNNLIKSGSRVGLDTLTGVAEVPFQSLVSMLFEGRSWNEAWEENGGWEQVKSQAAIAGLSSFAGEAFSFRGNVKTTNAKNVFLSGDSNAIENVVKNTKNKYINNALDELTDAQLNQIKFAASKDVDMQNLFYRQKMKLSEKRVLQIQEYNKLQNEASVNLKAADKLKNLQSNILANADTIQKLEMLGDVSQRMSFIDSIFKQNSDASVIDKLVNKIRDISTDNLDNSRRFADRLIGLKSNYSDFKISVGEVDRSCASGKGIWLDNNYTDTVLYHELGHSLFDCYKNGQAPQEFTTNVSNAIKFAQANPSGFNAFFKTSNAAWDELYNQNLNAFYNSARPEQILKQVTECYDYNWQGLADRMKQLGVDENNIIQILNNQSRDDVIKYVTEQLYSDEIFKNTDVAFRNLGEDAIHDITDSIGGGFDTKNISVDGVNSYRLRHRHGSQYYKEYVDNLGQKKALTANQSNNRRFHEQIANFISLKLSNNTEKLQMLRQMWGEDWYKMMDDFSNNLLWR